MKRFIVLILVTLVHAFGVTDNDGSFSHYAQMHTDWCPSIYCPIDVHSIQTSPCCGDCMCHDGCKQLGTCCISAFASFEEMETSADTNRFSCVDTNYYVKNDESNHPRTGYFLIAKCHSPDPDTVIQNLCENPDIDISAVSIIPVTDGIYHYRNQYCAMCNDDIILYEVVPYTTNIGCEKPTAFTYEKMQKTIKDESRECNVTFTSPLTSVADWCIPSLISTCNVTGLWQKYDGSIERACQSFVDPFNLTFQNMFCYLCNSDTEIQPDRADCGNKTNDGDLVTSVNPPFLAVLDLDSVSRELVKATSKCNAHTQFADEKLSVCRDKLCDQSSYLFFTGTCAPKPDYVDSLCYVSFFKGTPSRSDIPQQQLETMLKGRFAQTIGEDGLSEVDIYVTEFTSGSRYFVIKMVTINSSSALNVFQQLDEAQMYIGGGIAIYFKIMFYDITLFQGKSIVEVPGDSANSKDILKRLPLGDVEMINSCFGREHVRFDKLLGCTFVNIEITELRISFKEGDLVSQYMNDTRISPIEFRRENDSVSICLSRYIELYNALPFLVKPIFLKEKAKFQNELSVKNLLSLACVCISIISLLATIVLFLSRSEFHSLPGYNTLALCVFLLLAQVVYQFGVGQTTLPYWACALIGMVCHLLWLCVMFAMNICTVDMFLIFRKLKATIPKHSWIQHIKRLTFIVITSLVFVIINVVESLVSTGGKALGYGGIICYISSKLMQIVTFIIPSVITVVANISLFIYVVLKINSSSIQSAGLQQERNYLAIYARLSTLTGFTWLIGFVLILVKSEILEYIFILLNASQGIFIMVAFSFKRTLWKICCPEKDVTTRSSRCND